MPICTAIPITKPTRAHFYALDHLVTGLAFDIHNEMGRLLDEILYKRELARRGQKAGLSVVREMKITASHQSFSKDFYLDLIMEASVPVETKCAEVLTTQHKSQALNYLFLCDLNHGTLLNMRPAKVEHAFVSTTMTAAQRKCLTVDTNRWQPVCREMEWVHDAMMSLLLDWGACLEISLYRSALTYLLGGQSTVIRPVEIRSDGELIGRQSMPLLTEDIAISVTAGNNLDLIGAHLERMLRHTPLKAIAWINLYRTNVSFVTLSK